MDDSALTHQLKQGNQLAFTILYDTYSEQVYRLAFKYLCNKELAEDAVQNLFMKVWIKRTSLDESRPLNHFLFTVLKKTIYLLSFAIPRIISLFWTIVWSYWSV